LDPALGTVLNPHSPKYRRGGIVERQEMWYELEESLGDCVDLCHRREVR
jgi:hypothetical protein